MYPPLENSTTRTAIMYISRNYGKDHHSSQSFNMKVYLKFRYFEKDKKFEKIFHLVLKSLSNVKTKIFFQICVASSEYLNFIAAAN